jgi:hypothetical protein
MGVLKMGTVALDGTKIHAQGRLQDARRKRRTMASRHSALSYEHAGKIEAQLNLKTAVENWRAVWNRAFCRV